MFTLLPSTSFRSFSLLSLLCLSACSLEQSHITKLSEQPTIAGITLVESITQNKDKTVIPYTKYVLDNGLTLILHEDNSDPLVHVDVTYHVGSAREDLGKSGFAHFFEHMMFQGSEHVADEQHFKIVTEAGGTLNGTTSSDITNYYQTVPANQLEKMLWLESDRMGFLLNSVTQKKFEVQRETVKNERGQRIDNQPYGLLYERVAEALYPNGHPYSWQTIGYIEDLNRVNVNDLKAFFLKWYGPNNATLTIGGDIDKAQTLAWVKKYFGDIPKGPEVNKPTAPKVELTADRYISLEDNVHLPLLYMTFPTVKIRHEDEAPLDILSSILGGGKTSLFYKNLVKKQLAVQAGVSHPCRELACTFNLLALPHPASGKSLKDIEKIMRDTLVEFEQRGVVEDDLIKVKAAMAASFVFGLQSVSGKVGQLAINETYSDNPNYIEHDINRYASVTKEDVMRVYKKYIKDKFAVVMSVVPKGKSDMIAAPDNVKPLVRNYNEISTTTANDLNLRTTPKTFSRDIMPAVSANKAVSMPELWQEQLPNGIKLLATENKETPTTSLLLKIPAGHFYEQKNKAGLVYLLANMLNESTLKNSAEDISQALQKLGSSISFSASNHYLNVQVNTLTKHLDATLVILQEKLLQPAFLDNEFERVKRNALQLFFNNKKNPSYLAKVAYRQLLHKDNIAATPLAGNEASLANISLDDLKRFYQTFVKPQGSQLITVSSLSKSGLVSSFKIFDRWQGQGKALNLTLAKPDIKKGHIYLINKENATQSVIRIGKRSLTHDITGEYYQAKLMNFILGGAFNSRLNLNLREDKGYTYGASSYFSADKLSGFFTAEAEVRSDITDKALVEMLSEIKNYVNDGIRDDEIAFMRKAINQKDALKYETPGAKMHFLAQILEYNLTPDFVAKRTHIVDNISPQEINELAKKHLNIDDMIIVIVGDAKALTPKLKALNYQVIDYKI